MTKSAQRNLNSRQKYLQFRVNLSKGTHARQDLKLLSEVGSILWGSSLGPWDLTFQVELEVSESPTGELVFCGEKPTRLRPQICSEVEENTIRFCSALPDMHNSSHTIGRAGPTV